MEVYRKCNHEHNQGGRLSVSECKRILASFGPPLQEKPSEEK